jgi:HD-GYP domain-containing protein (c-di-GMP phosphodiesterase class II)
VDDLAARKAKVRKSYANILSSIKDTAHKLSANQGVGLRNSVRLVQKMVDLIRENETLFIGISTIRIYDDYTYAHSLNVAILAMCLGKRIGLSNMTLERLGMCGLFHDLGKVEIPKGVLNKQGKLNGEEFALIQTHSMHSARLILKLKANGDRKSKLLVPPFEHHMGFDYSGYPKVSLESGISLFGRIITIADVYDAVTSPRVYRSHAMSPDKALAMMMEQAGTKFDPILLKVFIRMLGRYPIGTVVRLGSGEIGVVIGGSEKHFSRPRVQLLFRDDKKRYRKGAFVDLSERDSKTNQYTHVIRSTMHPAAIGVQPAEFIV